MSEELNQDTENQNTTQEDNAEESSETNNNSEESSETNTNNNSNTGNTNTSTSVNMVTLIPRFTINPPVLQALEVTENGEYTPDPTKYDGFSSVKVDLKTTELEVNGTGVWVPPADYVGFSQVTVTSNMESLNVTENGDYQPSEGYNGFSHVHVNVQSVLTSLNVTENGDYQPEEGVDGFNHVHVNIEGQQHLNPTVDYNDGTISWNVENPQQTVYSSVFVNDVNIYNGYETSCDSSEMVQGDNVIKVCVFDVRTMLTGSVLKTVNIQE